jgi:uncharacterized protein
MEDEAMSRVVHFEIHADSPDRAIQFYTTVFGWTFTRWPGGEDYWLITTGFKEDPGIDGGMIKRKVHSDGTAVIAYVCTIDVKSLDDTLAKVALSGGVTVIPKRPIPGVGWLAYSKDTEGNIFGIMQADPSAR